MAKEKSIPNHEVEAMVNELRSRPELFVQFKKLMEASDLSLTPGQFDINAFECKLVPLVRETGKVALQDYAQQCEQAAAKQAKQEAGTQVREKKR